jgi:hypothetical protein
MYRRWASAYQFKWTPILTYTLRHIELLRWLEEHVEPVSFTETDTRRWWRPRSGVKVPDVGSARLHL